VQWEAAAREQAQGQGRSTASRKIKGAWENKITAAGKNQGGEGRGGEGRRQIFPFFCFFIFSPSYARMRTMTGKRKNLDRGTAGDRIFSLYFSFFLTENHRYFDSRFLAMYKVSTHYTATRFILRI
jgi:hypothetical protein